MIKYIAIALGVIGLDVLIFISLAKYEGQIQHANFIDALYWVVSTSTTVGYGDIVLISRPGKVFAMFVQISGILIVFGILITFVITPWFQKTMVAPLPIKAPAGISDHIIICGYNQLIKTLVDELNEQDMAFLIIENDEEMIRELMQKQLPCMYGIASEGNVLKHANITSAHFVIANRSDEENANIVLTARNICDVKIVAIVEEAANIKYLKYAGADRVVSPKLVLGRVIGRKAMDPYLGALAGAIEFFEGISIVEFPIYPESVLVGGTLKDAGIKEKTGVNVIGIRKGGSLTFDVGLETILKENSVLLATGKTEQLSKLKELIH
ncbi:MAG: potassium channel family protein [Methanosarcinaceae archaeon]